MSQLNFGIHTVTMLLEKHPERVTRLVVLGGRQDKKIENLLQIAKRHNILVEQTSRTELDRLTNEANHQGIVAYTTKPKSYNENDLASILQDIDKPIVLVLDSVQDPHNLGACFRSADAAGVNLIIAPKDKAASITPIVSKVASGAAETVPFVQVTNLVRALEKLKELGLWIYGAAGEAENSIYQTDFKGPVALVMGSEGEGLRRLTREHCDLLVKIPMAGSVSSLNVSVATGVILFEVLRQRTII